jgi:hypothetical protein
MGQTIAVGNSPHLIRELGLFLRNRWMPRRKMTDLGGYRQATEPYRAGSVLRFSSDVVWAAEYGHHIRVCVTASLALNQILFRALGTGYRDIRCREPFGGALRAA